MKSDPNRIMIEQNYEWQYSSHHNHKQNNFQKALRRHTHCQAAGETIEAIQSCRSTRPTAIKLCHIHILPKQNIQFQFISPVHPIHLFHRLYFLSSSSSSCTSSLCIFLDYIDPKQNGKSHASEALMNPQRNKASI